MPAKNTNLPSIDREEVISLRKKHVGSPYKLFYKSDPLRIVRASGQYMYDDNGTEYLDCINNVPHVGHCHPNVVKAAADQMADLNTNTLFITDNLSLLAKKLTSLFPPKLSVCFFTNSGSEANDLALLLARIHTKQNDVIVLNHGYHGTTMATNDMSPYKYNENHKKPDWVHVADHTDTYRGKYNVDTHPGADFGKLYADDVKAMIDGVRQSGRSIAALFAESIVCCGGQVFLPPGYLREVYKHVRDAGGICVADEVQVGFGRVGTHWWAYELQGEDIVPDIVTIGKSMGNAHPVAAIITTAEVAASAAAAGLEYFNTYGGNPVSCAVALAVIQTVEEENLLDNAIRVGDYLLEKLQQLQERHEIIGDIRAKGLFAGIELVENRKTKEPATAIAPHIINRLKDHRVLLMIDGPHRNVIKFKPPMCFTCDNVDTMIEKLDLVLTEVEAEEQPEVEAEMDEDERTEVEVTENALQVPMIVQSVIEKISFTNGVHANGIYNVNPALTFECQMQA